MRVILEHETTERRTVNGRRQIVSVWKRAWTAELLYADGDFIVTRSAGSHQTFRGVPSAARLRKPHPASWNPDGGIEADMWGHDPKHPAVVRLGLPRDRWGRLALGRIRISPASALALRQTMAACEVSFLGRDPPEKRRRSGKKGVCKPKFTRSRRSRG